MLVGWTQNDRKFKNATVRASLKLPNNPEISGDLEYEFDPIINEQRIDLRQE